MEHISLINTDDPLEQQVAKQAKIIDALLRRSMRRHSFGDSAYAAFQSAIALQAQIWAKTRDLERASTELETLRFDRERSQKNLGDALSVMEGGFALFTEGRLEVCNDLFRNLLPDQSHKIVPGLTLAEYIEAIRASSHLINLDGRVRESLERARQMPRHHARVSFVVGFQGDRWFQFSQQRTSSDNLIILQTEISDIVRRNRFEKDLLIDKQAHYLQAALDHMSAGIGTFSRDGELQIHNDGFRDLVGLPARLLHPGTRFSEIIEFIKGSYLLSRADLLAMNSWRQVLRRDGKLRKRLRHGGGQVLDLQVNILPDLGFLVDVSDVTLEARTTRLLEERVQERTSELTEVNRRLTAQSEEQARVEEELRLAKEKAEAAVSSKTRFLAAASHDLLQPMNAAKLLLSTLSDATRHSELEGMVERLQGSFASMETLLQDLLDISRLESTESELSPTDFCLGPLMTSVIEDQAPLALSRGVSLRVVPSRLWVRSDQRYLLRSIQNLVVNALQYTENGKVLLGCRRVGDQVRLEVWDTGIGISPADQKRIFEEFTRAKTARAGAGMGLGLSIVDRTCRHLGHKVTVRSQLGRGSVFGIEMAQVPAQSDLHEEDTVTDPGADQDLDLLVLAIENEPDLLFAMVQVLEGWGASVFGTGSIDEAVAVLRDIGIAPDVILADFHLDDGSTGLQAIRAIRAVLGKQVPAIMITADRSSDLLHKGREHGFSVLTKPVDLQHLRRLIEQKTGRIATRPPGEHRGIGGGDQSKPMEEVKG